MTLRLSGSRYNRYIFILSFLLVFIFDIFNYQVNSAAKEKNPFNSIYPSFPAAYADSSFAPFINPVFSDTYSSASISYIAQDLEDKKDFNHFFMVNYAGFLVSYSWIENLYGYNDNLLNAGTKLFTIGKGILIENMFGFGANYSFGKSSNGNFDGYKTVSLGFLLRPFSFLSLGYDAKDINNPEVYDRQTARSDVYSVSVRPINKITLSFEATKYENRKLDKSDMVFSADLNSFYGISAHAGISCDKNLIFGLMIPLGINSSHTSSIIFDGYTSNFNEFRSSALGITISGDKSESSITRSTRFLQIVLNEDINEIKTESIFGSNEHTFYDLLNAIKQSKSDESIKGIIIKIDKAGIGFAQIQELREELKLFRKSRKPVYVILNVPGNKEYYLASACDKIYYNPANVFAITGLRAEVYFFKEGLDKLGIKFESIARGPYKSFPEPYTRDHMSPAFKENLTSLISDLNEQYLNDIENDRSATKANIDLLLKRGIMTPEEALNKGFVDMIAYPTEAEADILRNNKTINSSVSLDNYINETEKKYNWGQKPEIAVIYVSGSIVHGQSSTYKNILPDTTGDETYREALVTAFTNSMVKAIVIRIDSGGGSSLASELMLQDLIKLKKEFNKPVVFSFGNTAASGGYYMACTGDAILGSKGSITGSIGVVAGKLSLKELYAKLGINRDVIKMSEFADIFSEAKDMSAADRKVIEQGVDYVYSRFKMKAAEARGISMENINKAAEGRVFTGNQAKNINLIDTFGGLIASIEMAKKLADISDNYTVIHLPESSEPIMELLGLNTESKLVPEQLKALIRTLDFVAFGDENFLYYCPYKLVIK